MRLSDGYVNHRYVIDRIHLDQKNKIKLERLKLKEGSIVTIIAKHKHYPFLVSMDGNHIAFSIPAAMQIEVIPCE